MGKKFFKIDSIGIVPKFCLSFLNQRPCFKGALKSPVLRKNDET